MKNTIKLLQNEIIQQEQNIVSIKNYRFSSSTIDEQRSMNGDEYKHLLLKTTKNFITELREAIKILEEKL